MITAGFFRQDLTPDEKELEFICHPWHNRKYYRYATVVKYQTWYEEENL